MLDPAAPTNLVGYCRISSEAQDTGLQREDVLTIAGQLHARGAGLRILTGEGKFFFSGSPAPPCTATPT